MTADEFQTQLAQLCDKRALTYGLLSRLFIKEIDETYLVELKKFRFPANTGDEAVDKGYRMIATYLSKTWANSVEELAKDYFHVFIGAGTDGFSAAYPYESVYTSEERLMMTSARDEVLAIYKSEGLNKADSWKEGEDHISLELEFMQTVARRSAEALRVGDEQKAASLLATQANFMNVHLMRWVPQFCEDMQKFAKTSFYQGLSVLTAGFLATDKEFLQSIVTEEE